MLWNPLSEQMHSRCNKQKVHELQTIYITNRAQICWVRLTLAVTLLVKVRDISTYNKMRKFHIELNSLCKCHSSVSTMLPLSLRRSSKLQLITIMIYWPCVSIYTRCSMNRGIPLCHSFGIAEWKIQC